MTDGFSLQSASNAEFWCLLCCGPVQAVEKTTTNSRISSDEMTFMWCHYVSPLVTYWFNIIMNYSGSLSKCVYFTKYYSDVTMSTMASQIFGVSTVCFAVCSDADQRKHQSSASLAFVRGIHRWLVNSPHKGPVTRKMFSFGDVFMINLIFFLLWLLIHALQIGTNGIIWCDNGVRVSAFVLKTINLCFSTIL